LVGNHPPKYIPTINGHQTLGFESLEVADDKPFDDKAHH
jgi:hypothetical protein